MISSKVFDDRGMSTKEPTDDMMMMHERITDEVVMMLVPETTLED